MSTRSKPNPSRKRTSGIIPARMSMDSSTKQTKVCPTCGTRLAENATRCLVCGTQLTATAATAPRQRKAVQASRMPQLTLSLPAAIGLLALVLLVGAALVYFGLTAGGRVTQPTAVPSDTPTPTITLTPTETLIPTPAASSTPEPPIEYTVAGGDTCSSIALTFGVSINSIILANNLGTSCTLFPGTVLKIPRPTPTVTPPPTVTLEPAAATRAACEKVNYTVRENDTLSIIAANYTVSIEAIKEFNGLPTDNVLLGQTLVIPLCARAPTPGPTPTPTIPPPYPAPSLLLPADGASFSLANDTITLQWASIGTLRDNEAYMVMVEDLTEGQGNRITAYVTDTKYIVPVSFRPRDNLPHIMRWTVVTVRQSGSDDQGQIQWTPAGAVSAARVFSWMGTGPAPTQAP